jgi:hypothetical protein
MKHVHASLLAFSILVLALVTLTRPEPPEPANVTLYVQAPAAGQDAYNVTYDCEQHKEIDLLLPDLRDKTKEIIAELGPNWAVFETKRGLCRQARLMHREVTGRMDSKHLIGAAVDFVCWDKNGKASWDCAWANLGAACKKRGLIWGGEFPALNDPPHCELPPLQPL